MSYILDALKRADAERGRNTAPSSLRPDAMSTNTTRQPEHSGWFWALGLAAAVALIAGGAWLWLRPSLSDTAAPPTVTDAPHASPATAAPSPVEPPPPAAPASPLVAPPVVRQAPAPTPEVQVQVQVQKAQAQKRAEQTASEVQGVAPAPIDPMPGMDPAAAAAARPPADLLDDPRTAPAPVLPILAKASPPPSDALRPVPPTQTRALAKPARAQSTGQPKSTTPMLNAAQGAGLPQIAVSGSSYSTNPAHRMLIANGQVLKEGQELSPGLTLESIGQRSAVFNQHGTRFNVNY